MTSYWTRHLRLLPALLIVISALSACKDDKQAALPDGAVIGDEPASGAEGAAVERSAFDETAAGTDKVHVAAAQRRAVVPSLPPLDISTLLTEQDLPSTLPQKDARREVLAGQKPGPNYNATHFRKANAPEFGVGLQVWRFDDHDAARDQLALLRDQYLGVVENPVAGAHEHSFSAERAKIRSYLTSPNDSPYLIGISCGAETCKEWKAVTDIARTVEGRL